MMSKRFYLPWFQKQKVDNLWLRWRPFCVTRYHDYSIAEYLLVEIVVTLLLYQSFVVLARTSADFRQIPSEMQSYHPLFVEKAKVKPFFAYYAAFCRLTMLYQINFQESLVLKHSKFHCLRKKFIWTWGKMDYIRSGNSLHSTELVILGHRLQCTTITRINLQFTENPRSQCFFFIFFVKFKHNSCLQFANMKNSSR